MRLVVFAVTVGCAAGCADDGALTAEERDVLAAFALPAAVPADPSNRFADDPTAAALGQRLFFDPRFSGALEAPNDGATDGSLGPAGATGRIACVSCHEIGVTGAGADLRSLAPTSLGASYMPRNTPTVIDAALVDIAGGGWQGWDGSRDSLWAIPLPAIEGVAENTTRLAYAHALYDSASYRAAYQAVFGPLPDLSNTARFPASGKPGDASFDGMAPADRAAIDRVFANAGKSLEAYMRRLTSRNAAPSPFDRMLAGDDSAMSPAAIRGAKLFIGKAACDECHRGPSLSDGKFHAIGVPQQGSHVPRADTGRTDGVALVLADPFNRAGAYSDLADATHLAGLAAPGTAGAFRTAPLRNVARTAPYMHDGVFATLPDVIEHYNRGGIAPGTDVELQPLLLDEQEIADLAAFLESLSDGPFTDPALVTCPAEVCP
jgi:cytochrome c peroxidase